MDGQKIRESIELIWRVIEESERPAAMLSFGKDSMVMADLIRGSGGQSNFPRSHGFPIDVIYHRDPWFPWKHEFAEGIIRSWSMEVHDFPPMAAGVKVKPDMLELVARYNFGDGFMDIPKNMCAPEEYPRRDYICGLNDWLLRPKALVAEYPWDTVLMGHRDVDVDPYIEEHHIPVQDTRYEGRKEVEDKWYNNDYIHVCARCIDPREMRAEVFCPKLKRDVRNRGDEVLQLHGEASYIKREKENICQE
jgi:hypothetical protein